MSRPILIYISAFFVLITCLSHMVGTLMEIPENQLAMRETVEIMENTMVPMPIGEPRSYMEILDGNNFVTSLFLFVCSIQLISIARLPVDSITDRILLFNAVGLCGFSIISGFYFFPIPSIFTGISAFLCCIAIISKNKN